MRSGKIGSGDAQYGQSYALAEPYSRTTWTRRSLYHHATPVNDEGTARVAVESPALDPLDQRCLERGMGASRSPGDPSSFVATVVSGSELCHRSTRVAAQVVGEGAWRW